MSYQLREITIPNALRYVTASNPLYLPVGSISGCDATSLIVSVVVSAVSNIPAETAQLMLQESLDGGVTWDDLPGLDADVITTTGTYRVKVTNNTGVISPQVRLSVTPTGNGSLYLSKAFATFCPGQIIPRDNLTGGIAYDFGSSVSASRVAAILGNINGQADWNSGNATAQTLRVIQAGAPVSGFDTDYGTVGASTMRSAAQIGNATGAAAFGSGTNSAQVLRITPATDAQHLLNTRHEAAATPVSTRPSNGTNFAAFGAGTVDATTQRTTPASDSPHLLATRHETVTTPLAARLSDGTDFIVAGAIAAAQKTVSTATKALDVVSFVLGWDGTTHRELAVTTDGNLQAKPEYSAAFAPVSGASLVLTANTWVQLISSTSAKALRISYFQDSGYAIELGFGAGGAEVSKIVLAQSGQEDLLIPAGTRVSLRCGTTNTLSTFWLSALV